MGIGLKIKKIILYIIIILSLGCQNRVNSSKHFTKDQLIKRINKDSLIYNDSENTYFDRFGDRSGSLYKFNAEGELVFYCFLNGKAYPYSEYYDRDGGVKKIEGRPSIQVQYVINSDKSYRFSFLFSTFRKSDYKIRTVTNFKDSAYNELKPATGFSNVGFFNIVFRTYLDVLKTTIVNQVSYFDSLRNTNYSFNDTLNLKNVISD